MIKVYNPLKEELTVIIFGKTYSVKGEDSINVEEHVAEYWKSLQNFLVLSEAKQTKKEVKADENGEVSIDELIKSEEVEVKKTKQK